MAGKDVAEMLGVSSAAAACNWARAAEDPSPAAGRSPIEPMRDSGDRAHDGFGGSLEERVRQLELENDILRAAAKVLKAESPSAMTNREKALVINELRATTSRSSGCRAARCACPRSSTASTAACPPDRSARARTRSSPTAA